MSWDQTSTHEWSPRFWYQNNKQTTNYYKVEERWRSKCPYKEDKWRRRKGRYIIEIEGKNLSKVEKILKDNSVYYDDIGLVTKNEIIIDKEPILHIDDLIEYNKKWLEEYMDK